jgi:hypothetical protein
MEMIFSLSLFIGVMNTIGKWFDGLERISGCTGANCLAFRVQLRALIVIDMNVLIGQARGNWIGFR